MSRAKSIWGLVAVTLGVVILYSLLPLGTAFQFGEDEGYQLITGFLISKNFVLYKEIWYDQPPVFVLLLAWCFKLLGPSILAARLLAACFALTMFGAFYQLVRLCSTQWMAALASFFLLAAPGVIKIGASAMQEVPAFALAMVSVLLLSNWRRRAHWSWLLGSGAAMGVALGIKFTAAIVVPAIFTEILLTTRATLGSIQLRRFSVFLLKWCAVAGTTLLGILLLWGRGSFNSSYQAHFAEHSVPWLGQPGDFSMPSWVFIDHAECVVAAIIGIIFVVRNRRLRELSFPFVWLATALTIHSIHRPWWLYYYLHLAIPLAWFAAFAIAELTKPFLNILAKSGFRFSSARTWKPVALCTLAAIPLVRSEQRIEVGVAGLRAGVRINAEPILSKIKQYADRTHWIYVQFSKEVYAFHARLPMPPELAVVTLKRFWSDQISDAEILQICKHYKPEQLLLNPAVLTDEWRLVLHDYSAVYESKELALFVHNQILHGRAITTQGPTE